MQWMSIFMLAVQAGLTVVVVELLRRTVLPAANRMPQPGLLLDLWVPVLLLLPMLTFIARVDHSVRGAGWMAVGAPIVCGAIGLGLAMMASRPHDAGLRLDITPRMLIGWTGAGVLLLLLGAAHEVNLLAGQLCFAIGAVLLWMNAPDDIGAVKERRSSGLSPQAGGALTLALFCAIGQSVASYLVHQQHARVSGAMTIAGAALVLSATAVVAGPFGAIRLAGWTAGYGVVLAVGILSLRRLLPQTLDTIDQGRVAVVLGVVHGFGAFAIEACALLLLAGAATAIAWLPRFLRVSLGLVIIVAAAAIAAFRLASI